MFLVVLMFLVVTVLHVQSNRHHTLGNVFQTQQLILKAQLT